MNFKWEDITLRDLLIAVPLVCSGLYWLATEHATMREVTDTMQQIRTDVVDRTDRLRIDMTAQFREVREESRQSVRDVRQDIANLPSLSAQMEQINKRTDQNDHRIDALSSRMDQGVRNGDMRDGKIGDLQKAFMNNDGRISSLEKAVGMLASHGSQKGN